MNEIALPVSAVSTRKSLLWVGFWGVAALAAAGALWLLVGARQASSVVPSNMVYSVVPMDLNIRIQKDGELQAINNVEINCDVEGQTAIVQIVPEGSSVKKGQTLLVLDSSAIRQKIEDTTLDLQKAENDLTTAQEMLDIQESSNTADIEAATVALTLAKLDLKQYVEGTYLQQLANAKTELQMALVNLKNQEDKLAQTRALFGKGFVTSTAVKDDELSVTTAQNTVAKASTALKVLEEYTHQMDLASKQNALSQAEQRLARQRRFNASNLAQRTADVQAKTQSLAVIKRRMERYEEQLEACTIKAPTDGLVVYGTTGDRNAQSPIQEGAQVRERQLLLRLPDTSTMKVVVRIQEAQVSRLREGMRARVRIVGVPQQLGATLTRISVLADSGARWSNPDLKEYPVELALDETPPSLKPGMGAVTEIQVDQLSQVMAVPLSTIYSVGSESFVFVREADRFMPHKVRIGRTNETYAEILNEGVTAGQQVAMLEVGQGQDLLEKSGIKLAPSTQPDEGGRRGRGGRRGGGGGRGDGQGGGGGGLTAGNTGANAPGAEQQRPSQPAQPQ